MSVIPVLFEDHTLANFRPLTWSLPAYEMRVGMFSLRERVGHLCSGDESHGVMLGRPVLDGLQGAASWINGAEAALSAMSDPESVFLWLNGRLAWSHSKLEALLAQVSGDSPVHLRDDLGLLAFSCSGKTSLNILASWTKWEAEVAAGGGWSTSGAEIPPWSSEYVQGSSPKELEDSLQWIWQIVPQTQSALQSDLEFLKTGKPFTREPFGVCPLSTEKDPVWARPSQLLPWSDPVVPGQVTAICPENLWCGPEVAFGSGVSIDASKGPVILDRNVTIMPNSFLEGPLYIGPGSTVKAGATIYGESSFGLVNKISGEIGESTFGDFSNKQHDGFIGHAVIGSWVNLGAMTTCSDLKNNYGNIRVDLGNGQVDSGLRFVGLLMGDHAKTAIGTLFNTGTSVGFASNIFGGGMPPKFVGNFRWGGQNDCPAYGLDQAAKTAEVVLSRRGCQFTPAHLKLFKSLAD